PTLLSSFFLNQTAATEIYTLSLHDALPIFTIVDTTAPVFNTNLPHDRTIECSDPMPEVESLTADDLCSKASVTFTEERVDGNCPDRKSTRLNSSHVKISYAVFCLKKKTK